MSSTEVEVHGDRSALRTECRECGAGILTLLAVGGREPSPLAVKTARVARRTCDDCIAKVEEKLEQRTRKIGFEDLVKYARIPAELRGLRFEDMVRKGRRGYAIGAAEAWAKGELERPGLLLMGAPGVGKTRLAATAAWARLQTGRAIKWVSVAKMLTSISRAYADVERRRALDLLTGVEPLVLDDFDKVNPSEFGRQQIYTAIDERVLAKAPMIVTANLSVTELGERFGDPISSRLAGHCVQLVMDGEDWRVMELAS